MPIYINILFPWSLMILLSMPLKRFYIELYCRNRSIDIFTNDKRQVFIVYYGYYIWVYSYRMSK